jgi:large conductance mechanosensitive channel protein
MAKSTKTQTPQEAVAAAQAEVHAHKKALSKARREAAVAKRELTLEKAKGLSSVTTSKLEGFLEFIRERGVVGLAIGLAIGTAATAVVTQIVTALISPTIALLIGTENLAKWSYTLEVGGRSVAYPFGALADALIKFIAIAAVIYFVVLGLKLDKLDKKKEDK